MTTQPLTEEELKTLAELEAKATPLPFEAAWHAQRTPICKARSDDHDGGAFAVYGNAQEPINVDTDIDLMVAARNALPRLLADLAAAREEVKRLRDGIAIAEDQSRRRTEWFAWCQQHIKGACGRYHDENAKAYILQLESELDAARRECVTGREAYSTIGCSFCLYENDRPARDAYEAARAERAKWAAFADAAGHMRDWLHECSIDQEESHTVRNEARELVAAFDAAKEAK